MYGARMRFGKYYGELVTDLPPGYLKWLLREVNDPHPFVMADTEETLESHRARGNGGRPTGNGTTRNRTGNRQARKGQTRSIVDLQTVVRRWFSELSLRWHPDRGGSVAGMAAINDAYERLRRLLGM